MSEHPMHHHQHGRRGHLRLVGSETNPEQHEAELGLVFLDIDDTSLTTTEVEKSVDRMVKESLTPAIFRDFHAEEYPKVIAHSVLAELHVQSDQKRMRELALKETEELAPDEREEMDYSLEIEQLFQRATTLLEEVGTKHQTHEFVGDLEEHMDEHDYYSTNVLRACIELQKRNEMFRVSSAVIVANRIIKTMLWMNEKDRVVTPLK